MLADDVHKPGLSVTRLITAAARMPDIVGGRLTSALAESVRDAVPICLRWSTAGEVFAEPRRVVDCPAYRQQKGHLMSGAESDVPDDPHLANTRRTGGRDPKREPDEHSTTGTTESEEFVGRVGGDEGGDSGESGAEARAESQRSD